jgi:propionyl-CoA synthetase
MEEVLASHPDVAECAVIGAKDELKGQTPVGLVVLKNGVNRPHEDIAAELVALVRERIGPVASFRDARVVARLPKTRSGKILRASIRKIADGESAPVPPTIEDPAALDELASVLRGGH